jgi:hypothetical protein
MLRHLERQLEDERGQKQQQQQQQQQGESISISFMPLASFLELCVVERGRALARSEAEACTMFAQTGRGRHGSVDMGQFISIVQQLDPNATQDSIERMFGEVQPRRISTHTNKNTRGFLGCIATCERPH